MNFFIEHMKEDRKLEAFGEVTRAPRLEGASDP